MSDTVERTVKSMEVKASTNDAGNLLINEMKMQQNLEPKDNASLDIPVAYYNYNYDLGQYDLGWDYEGNFLEEGQVLTLDIDAPGSVTWGWGGSFTMQISIGGRVYNGGQQGPPIPVPRACKVIEIYSYCRMGSCTITVYKGPVPAVAGSTLIKNQILSATITGASIDCQDAIVQVRCI